VKIVQCDLWFPLMNGHARRLQKMTDSWERLGLCHPRDFRLPLEGEDFEE